MLVCRVIFHFVTPIGVTLLHLDTCSPANCKKQEWNYGCVTKCCGSLMCLCAFLSTLTQGTADWLTNVHHLTLQCAHTDMHANVRIG